MKLALAALAALPFPAMQCAPEQPVDNPPHCVDIVMTDRHPNQVSAYCSGEPGYIQVDVLCRNIYTGWTQWSSSPTVYHPGGGDIRYGGYTTATATCGPVIDTYFTHITYTWG
jgi:hypothetical protein